MMRILQAVVLLSQACQLSLGTSLVQDAQPRIMKPKIVVPGEWMTNKEENFFFLPLEVPGDIELEQCKVMSNGDTILVVVTKTPGEQPDTNAMKKYKLIVQAMKDEVGHDENALKQKLATWLSTEEDDEVRTHIQAALDSLVRVQAVKQDLTPRSVSVRLGVLAKNAMLHNESQAFIALRASKSTPLLSKPSKAHSLPSVSRISHHSEKKSAEKHDMRAGIIKESFAVEVPYPVPTEKVFILKTAPTMLMVGMPLKKNSLAASGISTGGKPYLRVPVFTPQGQRLAGPAKELSTLTGTLDVPSLVSQGSLKQLQ